MRQSKLAVLVSLLLALTSAVSAQELTADAFRKAWAQGMELEDDKLLDKAMKRGHRHALLYFEGCWHSAQSGNNQSAELQCEALFASWERCFKNRTTLEKLQRWIDGSAGKSYTRLQTIRSDSARIWGDYTSNVATGLIKKDYQSCFEDYQKLAKAAESIGQYYEASELWGLASVIANKMPGKTIEDLENAVFAIEQQLAARDNWGYIFDRHYTANKEFVKAELLRIEEAKKKADKRSDEGYDADAKGVESLVMPNVPAKKFVLNFAPLKDWKKELDYGPRGGPVPQFWWMDSLGESGSSRKMGWFRLRDMYLLRRGANKFAINWSADDTDTATEITASGRTKVSTFYLGSNKTLPYAMFFWLGSDQETMGVAKCNYSASDKVANLYYRSASSWKATVDTETLTFYDDDASGRPGDQDPFKGELKSPLVGDHSGEGVIVPLFDSMKVGKGKRMPYSQFVKLAAGWHYMESASGTDIALRPLNPEYVKSAKVQLSWSGAKPTAPDQLVIQGKGDYQNAIFDVAGGKPVEVPAGEYRVIWGRIVNGKGARMQMAQIFPTDNSESFVVKAGETFKLEMGGPFKIDFEREGDKSTTINALTICVTEKSGCKLTGLQGLPLDCQVMVAKDDTGKGKKQVGAFVPFTNDQLIGEASRQYNNLGFMVACFPMPKGYKKEEMVMSLKLPADGMKVTLFTKKKHKFFGKFAPNWK